jgi:predicted CoA-binding protein
MKEDREVQIFDLSDDEIIKILSKYRNVAVVGLSADESKDSNRVAQFLLDRGFHIFPVNPNSTEILGRKCYARLSDIEDEIDIVDIFRKSEAVGEIVDEAIKMNAKVVWMQQGVVNHEAAGKARAAGLKVVMDRCIKRAYSAYFPPDQKI